MTHLLSTTPAQDGFFMPGEFAPHAGCWMVWPERPDNWRSDARPAQAAFAAVAEAIHPSDPVTMAVSADQYADARATLSPGIRVVEMSSNDSWMRDIGPSFVIDSRGGLRAVDWTFNAWGGHENGLYSPWDLDDAVAAKVAEIEGADRYRAPLVMEGGALHVDGEGTAIVTAENLLSKGRNPTLSQSEIEAMLCAYLGITKVLWIPRGVYQDETTGHVDNLIHLVKPGVVTLTWTEDRGDPQFERSAEALDSLSSATDANGRHLQIVKLPTPGPLEMTEDEAQSIEQDACGMVRCAGTRLAGSYSNFYIGNTRVVFPLLDPRYDDAVHDILAQLFPGRQVIGVPGREILLGGGNIHCITQQVPAV